MHLDNSQTNRGINFYENLKWCSVDQNLQHIKISFTSLIIIMIWFCLVCDTVYIDHNIRTIIQIEWDEHQIIYFIVAKDSAIILE